ncbi:MAG: hypothetical protein QOC80_1498 [Frankiaceae bacterium]|nr:hypothetical protein [Frankiaceae bacterium]
MSRELPGSDRGTPLTVELSEAGHSVADVRENERRRPVVTPIRERAVRIANFSGYLGDRPEALSEVLAGDPVDVLIGDYLAEITLAALAGRYRADR